MEWIHFCRHAIGLHTATTSLATSATTAVVEMTATIACTTSCENGNLIKVPLFLLNPYLCHHLLLS